MKFNILGTWYNLLGSYMIIEAVNDKSIIGKYHTKVGDAAGIYELKGQVDTDIDKSTAIGGLFFGVMIMAALIP